MTALKIQSYLADTMSSAYSRSKSKDLRDSEIAKYLQFTGLDEEWPEWKLKTKIIGKEQGWWSVIETSLDLANTNNSQLNDEAMHYMSIGVTGDAFAYIEASNYNAHQLWKDLCARYNTTDDIDLIDLTDEFTDY